MSADLLFHLLLAMAVVVIAGRAFGLVARHAGQPPVIGEVLSGIMLGPSLLGLVAPAAEAYLFPESVKPPLDVIAQVGIVLYMFLVGLELDTGLLKARAGSLLITSQASIVAPFAFGCLLAAQLYEPYAPTGVSRAVFALFMGVAMSITAFPVLARILADRNLTKTELGVSALTCAAINDVMAWCLLCAVIIVIATAGKFGGGALAGRRSGMSWRFAAQLGALMNTRGLMELIVLTVGLRAGIITRASSR